MNNVQNKFLSGKVSSRNCASLHKTRCCAMETTNRTCVQPVEMVEMLTSK